VGYAPTGNRPMAATAPPPWRDRAGFCGADPVDRPAGSLGPAQRATLQAVAARCKLGHDLLACFTDRYRVFPDELVVARTRELAAIGFLLTRYGLSDPTVMRRPGVMADAVTQADYDRLVAEGRAGRAAALEVTARLAAATIQMLDLALTGLTAADVRHTYLHLLMAAHQQLRTAQAWSSR
jgi:hypothetical protein